MVARKALYPAPLHVTIIALMFLSGCQWGSQARGRVPEVKTRFTANPLAISTDGGAFIGAPQASQIKVGLAMQSSVDPAEISFASRLGTVLVRELQLSSGGYRVTPLAAMELRTAVPSLETNDVSDVITVALQEPTDTLPPHLPPSPFYDTSTPVLVDQILVIRVMEYRPYYPMLVTLDLRVLDGESQEEIVATTVSWSGDDYLLADECCEPKKWWRTCDEPHCGPAPGHNSPQALMHEIARDVTGWYLMSTDPMMGGVVVTNSDSQTSTPSQGSTQLPCPTQLPGPTQSPGSTQPPATANPSASTPEATVESGVTQTSHTTGTTQTKSDEKRTESKSHSRSNSAARPKTKSSNEKTSLQWSLPKFALPKQSEKPKKQPSSDKSSG